jgi:hypothetical protein
VAAEACAETTSTVATIAKASLPTLQ